MPVSVFWHWWHGCAYDAGFPEYLPPREGDRRLSRARSRAPTSRGHPRPRLHEPAALGHDHGKLDQRRRRALRRQEAADGTVQPEVYNTFTRPPCASMCMGTEFWRNKYAGLAEARRQRPGRRRHLHGPGLLQPGLLRPQHGHPLGGGVVLDGKAFAPWNPTSAGAAPPREPVALAGEGCGEAWLPHLDLMLSLQVSRERYAAPGQWEPIPFFHAVYHRYAVLYGNYSSLTLPPYDDLWPAEFAPAEPLELLDRKFRDQFRLEQARAFVWGQQPTLANFRPEHLVERRTDLAYLRQLVRLRQAALPYLLHGTFLRPPRMNIPDMEIDMSRLSIYAGQQEAVQEYRKRVPQYLAGAGAPTTAASPWRLPILPTRTTRYVLPSTARNTGCPTGDGCTDGSPKAARPWACLKTDRRPSPTRWPPPGRSFMKSRAIRSCTGRASRGTASGWLRDRRQTQPCADRTSGFASIARRCRPPGRCSWTDT